MFQLGLFSNPWVTWGVLVTIGLQLLFTYAPAMNFLFHTAPIDWEMWVLIIGVGLGSYFIVELEKWIRRQLAGSALLSPYSNTNNRGEM
jgi:magnesium-transporting ATPase (P-type)